MSNLMSKFRKKVTVNIVDIFRFHIRRERGVDVVCHRASGHVPHILLTVFFRHADDIEVRRKGVFLSESAAGGFFPYTCRLMFVRYGNCLRGKRVF